MEEIFPLNPLIFPNSNHIISKKHFRTKSVYYIIDSRREFTFNHSIESINFKDLLLIDTNFYIKSVLEFIFKNYAMPEQSLDTRIYEILSGYSRVDFKLENLLGTEFNSFVIDRTPGLVGVVINLSRRDESIQYKKQLTRHMNKLVGICRIKDTSDKLRIPRSWVFYCYLLRMGIPDVGEST